MEELDVLELVTLLPQRLLRAVLLPWKYFNYSEKAMERRGDICILRK